MRGPRCKGTQIFPGYLPGAEDGPGGWAPWITGASPGKSLCSLSATGFFSEHGLSAESDWDYKTFRTLNATDLKAANEKLARGPQRYRSRPQRHSRPEERKLVLYHGWNDPAITPLNTIDYYESVIQKTGGKKDVDFFVRLDMVPGLPTLLRRPRAGFVRSVLYDLEFRRPAAQRGCVFGAVGEKRRRRRQQLLRRSFEGQEPKPNAKMTRPLCPYPQAAKYKGSGDPNDAANFECARPKT